MEQGRRHRWLHAPSPAMIVALVALVFAMSGTAVAASKLINGDKLIKKQSLSGNRLRSHTVTGAQIKVATLGKVPSAAQADTATTATTATNATHATTADTATNATRATNADTVGGVGASAFGTCFRAAGMDFKPIDSTTSYVYETYGAVSRTSGAGNFNCPVHLPQGAHVTKVIMYFNNVGAGDAGTLYFIAYRPGGISTLATVASSSASGRASVSVSLSTAAVVDNTANEYELTWSPLNTNYLDGAEVDYTLP